jgi:hypothetical protein
VAARVAPSVLGERSRSRTKSDAASMINPFSYHRRQYQQQ